MRSIWSSFQDLVARYCYTIYEMPRKCACFLFYPDPTRNEIVSNETPSQISNSSANVFRKWNDLLGPFCSYILLAIKADHRSYIDWHGIKGRGVSDKLQYRQSRFFLVWPTLRAGNSHNGVDIILKKNMMFCGFPFCPTNLTVCSYQVFLQRKQTP